MSRDLTKHAVRRLLEIGAPLRDEPDLGVIDTARYELRGELGRGGMGVVYEAWDRELRRVIALKVLSHPGGPADPAQERFMREARAAARLAHPHIAAVYDATPEAITMQRIDGDTLAARPPDDPRLLAALIRDAALAIHFAHGEGVIHRDIKPANLMVVPGDRPHVYVMDFGVAKERAVDASISLTESVVGTPAYMAPEQAAGRRSQVGPHTDVYGLGATLYTCLSGRAPFEDDDIYALLQRVVDHDPPPLHRVAPGVDRDLATIIDKCMAKEPQRRYASALALAGDLDRWLRGEPIQARPPSPAYRARRYLSRRQGQIAAGLAAAVLVFLVALPFVIQARARRVTAETVLALSQRVESAVRDARSARFSGSGYQENSFGILQAALDECRSRLKATDAGHIWFLAGRLLREQGKYDEALAAFDEAADRHANIPHLPLLRGLVLAALYRAAVPVFGETPSPELETWRARGAADLGWALLGGATVPTADRVFAEGQLAWLEGDLDVAIEKHREAVEMDAWHQEAHLSLSRLYLLVDRVDLAVRHSVVASDLLRGNRPAYVARAGIGTSTNDTPVDVGRELLPLEGLRELLVDFNLLLQLEPGNANTYGMRGQVQVRRAMHAMNAGNELEAWLALQQAAHEFTSTLTLQPDHAPALINRGVCNAQIARLLSASDNPARAADARADAMADYDAAIAADSTLAVAWFDRALLHDETAQLARMAMSPATAGDHATRARTDAAEVLARAAGDHPWRSRFEALAEDLR